MLRLGDIGWVFPDTNLTIKDKDHEKALNLALNRVHGEWDEELLNEVLIELEDLNLDHLTGFDLEFDDIDYDFITRVEDVEEQIEEEEFVEEEYDEIEDEDESIEFDEDDEIIEEEEKPKETPKQESRIRRGFIKYGDVYQIGDSSYIMFGKHNNEQDRTKLFKFPIQKTPNLPNDLTKVRTITKEINYYISDDAELLENIIIENNNISKKLK